MSRTLVPTLVFLCIGIALLAFPEKLQEWAIKAHRNTRGPARRIPDMEFVESPRYLRYLRALGAGVLLVGLLLVYATLTNR
jgi:hypothetical protein